MDFEQGFLTIEKGDRCMLHCDDSHIQNFKRWLARLEAYAQVFFTVLLYTYVLITPFSQLGQVNKQLSRVVHCLLWNCVLIGFRRGKLSGYYYYFMNYTPYFFYNMEIHGDMEGRVAVGVLVLDIELCAYMNAWKYGICKAVKQVVYGLPVQIQPES